MSIKFVPKSLCFMETYKFRLSPSLNPSLFFPPFPSFLYFLPVSFCPSIFLLSFFLVWKVCVLFHFLSLLCSKLFLPGEGKSYPFHYSGLDNSMDCIVHGIPKSQTQLSDFHSQAFFFFDFFVCLFSDFYIK